MFKVKFGGLVLLFALIINVNTANASEIGPGNKLKLQMDVRENFIISDLYLLDKNTGDIYYSQDGNDLFIGGKANDGLIYDEQGRQLNSLTYIYDKYKKEYRNNNDYMIFDTEDELCIFINYLQLYESSRQFGSVLKRYENGKLTVKKTELSKLCEDKSDKYKEMVFTLVNKIPTHYSIEEKIDYLSMEVAKTFDYDLSYIKESIDKALADSKGVCYHYAKYLHDCLESIGIDSEYLLGYYENNKDLHVWLKIFGGDKIYYRDPTKISLDYDNGLFPVNIYQAYLGHYQQYAVK